MVLTRTIDDGDYPHAADWMAAWFAAAGQTYIMRVASMCKPTAITENGYHPERIIEVEDGRISVGLPDSHFFYGDSISLDGNIGEEERYDLVYIEYNGSLELKVMKGVHGAKGHKDIPPGNTIVPICVVYFQEDSEIITEMKDCRMVMGPEHEHTIGFGLTLSEDLVNVVADEVGITNIGPHIMVKDGGVTWDKLNILLGEGVQGLDTETDGMIDTFAVDEHFGLQIIGEELAIDAADLVGEGMEEVDNKISVLAGDGLEFDNNKLVLAPGDGADLDEYGLKADLDTTTPIMLDEGDIEVDIHDLAGNGLHSPDGITIRTHAADFAGDGLDYIVSQIKLDLGNGFEFEGDYGHSKIKADVGDGLKLEYGYIRSDTDEDMGVFVDEDGLYIELQDIHVGNGLYIDNNEINFYAGDGLKISEGKVEVDHGRGIKENDGIGLDLKEHGGLRITADELEINAEDLAGLGIYAEDNVLKVDIGFGLKFEDLSIVADPRIGFGAEESGLQRDLFCEPHEMTHDWGIKHITENGFDPVDKIKLDMNDFFDVVVDTVIELGPSEANWMAGWIIDTEHPLLVFATIVEQTDGENPQMISWNFSDVPGDPGENERAVEVWHEGPYTGTEDEDVEVRVQIIELLFHEHGAPPHGWAYDPEPTPPP